MQQQVDDQEGHGVLTLRSFRRRSSGFTLIELMVTLTLVAVLLKLGVPSFVTWLKNTQVRTVADALQNAVRRAEAEAVSRNRQVVLSLTNNVPSVTSTAVSGGVNWALHVVPLPSETLEFIQGGVISDVSTGVITTGPGAICFNSIGRLVANPSPGVAGATCTIDGANPTTNYLITLGGADRPLRVTVALGGQVRMCDPNHSLASGFADGCS
jgi:type IV fimbrial biogenesis protein FimT